MHNNVEMKVENILPFAFSFYIGGPKMKRREKVSLELCIQMYMGLSLQQLMEGPTILVMNHIYNGQMSYKSGVMTCRSSVDDVSLGEKLSTLSMENLEKLDDNNADRLDAATKGFESNLNIMQSNGPYQKSYKICKTMLFCNVGSLWIEQFVLEYYPG